MSPGQVRLHSNAAALLCLAVAGGSICGLTAASPLVLCLAVVAIVVIGVPHGGLDHMTGKGLLGKRFGSLWAILFFGGYLTVAAVVAGGWLTFPLATAIGFFLVSAWHFGLEEDRTVPSSNAVNHLQAIAIGGLVIWVPALVQPDRMVEILRVIVPARLVSVPVIMQATTWIAWGLVPLALLTMVQDGQRRAWRRVLRNAAFLLLFCVADPLVSFVVYFCGWHSLRSLCELAAEYKKTLPQIWVAAAPMTLGAVALALGGMWFWSRGQTVSDASVRTLFISLSAIAVPHLLLHGPISGFVAKLSWKPTHPLEACR